MSQEIRTPFTGILGLTEVFRDETLESGKTSESIATVADQSIELSEIVNDFLVVSVADIKELSIRLATDDFWRSVDAVVASFSERPLWW